MKLVAQLVGVPNGGALNEGVMPNRDLQSDVLAARMLIQERYRCFVL
jgi:hypothetical protein